MLNFWLTAPREIEILRRDLPEIDLDFIASRRKTAGQRSNGAVKIHIAADQLSIGLRHAAKQ